MTWFRVDDKMHSHPKVMAALSAADEEERGELLAAIGIWTLVGSHCADFLTDGEVEAFAVYRFTLSKPLGDRYGDLLVRHGFWETREGGGWRFLAWPDYQPTRKSIEKTSTKRAASGRKGGRSKTLANVKQNESKPAGPGKANAQAKTSKGIPIPYPVPIPNPKEETTSASAPPDAVVVVFDRWVSERRAHNPGARMPLLDEKRRKVIRARLAEGFSVEDLCAACAGIFRSPFHTGDNDRRKEYTDITVALRDAAHVEEFREKSDGSVSSSGVFPTARPPPDPENTPEDREQMRLASLEAERAIEAAVAARTG